MAKKQSDFQQFQQIRKQLDKITDYVELIYEQLDDVVQETRQGLLDDIQEQFGNLEACICEAVEEHVNSMHERVWESLTQYAHEAGYEMAAYALEHVTDTIREHVSEKIDELADCGDGQELADRIEAVKSDIVGVADDAHAQLRELKEHVARAKPRRGQPANQAKPRRAKPRKKTGFNG